jgi:small subunit ribosomal protein S4
VVIHSALESRKGQSGPEWLQLDSEAMTGRVLNIPGRQSIATPINEQLIVELYSK